MFTFISIAHAATAKATAQGFVDKINDFILFPIIALLMAVAFIVFLYGAFVYVKNANNDTARETGRNHLMYGVIGMLVMLSAFAILKMAAATFGLNEELGSTLDTSSISDTSSVYRGPAETSDTVADILRDALSGDGAVSAVISNADLAAEMESNGVAEWEQTARVSAMTVGNDNNRIDAINAATDLGYISSETRAVLLGSL